MDELLASEDQNSRKIRRYGLNSSDQTLGLGWRSMINWVISETDPQEERREQEALGMWGEEAQRDFWGLDEALINLAGGFSLQTF